MEHLGEREWHARGDQNRNARTMRRRACLRFSTLFYVAAIAANHHGRLLQDLRLSVYPIAIAEWCQACRTSRRLTNGHMWR
ncbi:MAG: hypothetical protein C0516_16295 [Gemmatimonas sp.]|nr:hypothetical protein [Gemmatimonas sp.]